MQVKDVLERLSHLPSLADASGKEDLAALRRLADQAKRLASASPDDGARSRLLRAGYALVRRLVIWDQVQQIAVRGQAAPAPIIDLPAWQAALREIDELFTATGAAANWRKYLLIDRACHEFDQPGRSPAEQRELARDILHRLHSTQLSHAQEQFLKTPAFEIFDKQLRSRANEAPDLAKLLDAIEQYEQAGSEAHGRVLAAEYDRIRWSCDAAAKALAESVNSYYRNANVRVALSSELVNRLLPAQPAQVEAVDDNILGAWVSGQSQTNARLRVALLPDDCRWNIGLEAAGQVASNTASSKGPATFFQSGWSLFRARKRLTVDRRGIRLFSAEAEANANSDLEDYETSFDGIPLLGAIVRAVARNQYESSQPAAKVEVEGKIVVRATSQLDQQVAQKLEQGKRDLQVKILKPLQDLNLEPTAVDLHTTVDRLIGRYRLAGRDEVSAFSPRPQAPGDSMLSVQIHETAFNNVLDKLHLAGRRFELAQLYREMAARFTTRKIEVPEDLPENVFVTFADEEPVRLDCQDGHVRLTIRLRELVQEGTKNRWVNFTVRAYYAPAANQLDANLYRDGIIELIGEGRPLPIGQRVLLSGIFNRVLSRNRQIHVVNKQIAESPQLQDQQVTQFVIHDGWIGVALGPKVPGREAAMHPRGGNPAGLSSAGQLAGFNQISERLTAGGLVGLGLLQTLAKILLGGGLVFLDLVVVGLRQVLADCLAVLVLHLLAFAGVADVALGFLEDGVRLARIVLRHPFLVERRQGRSRGQRQDAQTSDEQQADTNLLHSRFLQNRGLVDGILHGAKCRPHACYHSRQERREVEVGKIE
jgi:hypothetical protein